MWWINFRGTKVKALKPNRRLLHHSDERWWWLETEQYHQRLKLAGYRIHFKGRVNCFSWRIGSGIWDKERTFFELAFSPVLFWSLISERFSISYFFQCNVMIQAKTNQCRRTLLYCSWPVDLTKFV